MAKVVDLNREDMKVLEGYIKNVDKLRMRLRVRKLELMDNPIIDNPGGGKSNLPSSPIEREIILCLKDTYYNNLDKIIKAVDIIYDGADNDVQEIMRLKYWEPKPGIETWEELAKHLHYSKTSILRVRERYLKDLANRIDYVNSDF
ncbi:transcriptional regulator [Mammaliicoccus sciuri]|uniref:transcriptional regulator n=1 Tax=Mammaliicoccus sciuri TaxID=1296 RepID=UPI002DB5A549|nr:transcriptional regulator [Mammaliicoccus sciuri]MEB5649010.1 transcriptional regulator [Mammaliicoccus sciuri]